MHFFLFKIFIFLSFIIVHTNLKADEGLNIICINIKNILGQKYKPLVFKIEAVGFQYYDERHKKFVMIKSNKLIIKDDFFAARVDNYELGFQKIVFEGEMKHTITMSKYDYKNKKFIDHYKCEVLKKYIN